MAKKDIKKVTKNLLHWTKVILVKKDIKKDTRNLLRLAARVKNFMVLLKKNLTLKKATRMLQQRRDTNMCLELTKTNRSMKNQCKRKLQRMISNYLMRTSTKWQVI